MSARRAAGSQTRDLSEIECVECEEHIGFYIIGTKLGHVTDEWSGPMALCIECGNRPASDEGRQ
jgi:hypothetical protein